MILMLFTVFLLFNCSNDGSDVSFETLNEADVFVVSEQHQEYQMKLSKDRKRMNRVFKSFSKENKKRYKLLLSFAIRTQSQCKQNMYIDSLSHLTGVNYRERIYMLYQSKKKTFENCNIKKRDYLKAVQRYNVRLSNEKNTRSVSTEEACLRTCEHLYYLAVADCNYDSQLTHACSICRCSECRCAQMDPTLLGYTACLLNAESNYEICQSDCN